ncbi:helix-turn-helix domain-containing protein [Streptomyces sp. NPDC005648]|uniref:transcriptional regulator n=1 Tax=Streptomyces sp. NPDC005648 TaxID=3157044 RepID=UPI0033B44C0F
MECLGYGNRQSDGGTVSGGDEVEEFAALLRRLKDRTDRSYGSLARRLTMNTSTLHRYCAGEAVPQEYAPVERLAAFCGATAPERLELHRLWLLAVAARQQVRAGANAEAGTGGSSEEAVPETDSSAETPAGPTQETAQETARGRAQETEAAQRPARETEQKTELEQEPADDPRPGAPFPSPAPRPWYRRRRVLVSTAVACALLATLGSLSALSNDRSSAADAGRPDVRRATASGSPRPSAKPSGSASPTAPRGSSSPDAGRKSVASPPPSSGFTGGGKQSTGTGTPLAWSANSQIWQGGCGHDYVIDKPPAQVPPPPVVQDAGAWAATQGAVHGRQTMVRISVQGRSSTAVVLEALRVRITGRTSPAPGTAYAMDQGCGGGLTPRGFDVNLDIDRPIAHPVAGNDTGQTIPAVQFPYRVSATDPEVLLVTATTETYDCSWYLELDWSSQGRTGTVRIDDHGRPFRTTGIKGLPRLWYGTDSSGERAWVPYDS